MSTKPQRVREEAVATAESELPEGWAEATLSQLAQAIQYGYTASAVFDRLGPRFLRITDIQHGLVDWNSVPTCDIGKGESDIYGLRTGDIVFARTGATTGKSFLIRSCPPSVFASYLIRVRPVSNIDSRFLALFFQTPDYWQFISENVAGNAQPNCNASKLAVLSVPLAPFSEQTRIADKVEQVLENTRTIRDRINKATKIIVSRFRQGVLAAACSGKLTEDWRGAHPQTESADLLLKKILAEGKKARSRPSVLADPAEGLYELPLTWSWVSFDRVCIDITVGHVGPMMHEYVDDGIPFLRSQNVREFRFEPVGLKFIPQAFHQRLAKSALHPGDVVVVRSGYPGTSCVIPTSLHEANCADLVVVRPSSALNPYYACIFINSAFARRYVEAEKVGIAQGHFNIGSMRSAPLPLPPFEEQNEIVKRVGALFKLADTIEKRVGAATLRAERLTQAILAKAFRGELVPTEAELARREGREYEPASVLLERIQAERAQDEDNTRAKHKPRLRQSNHISKL